MELTRAELELLRLWRATDETGRVCIMEEARWQAEAAHRKHGGGWRVIDGEARAQGRGGTAGGRITP